MQRWAVMAMVTLVSGSAMGQEARQQEVNEILMRGDLGQVSDPKMSLYVLTLPAGQSAPAHSHDGAVFAYVLEGRIENQVEPGPPQTLSTGGFFQERPGQPHRMFRNLSQTEAARILIFQNAGGLPPNTRPLLQQSLSEVSNQEAVLIRVVTPPGVGLAGAHRHPGPVFAYLLKGEIESQVEPEPSRVYRAGDVFYETPMRVHSTYRNPSQTEPAEMLLFMVHEKGKPLAVGVTQ